MEILLTNEVHTCLDNVIMIESNLENAAHILRLKRAFMVTELCEVRIVTDLVHPLPGDSLYVILDGEGTYGFQFLGFTADDYPGKIVLRL